MFKYYHSYDVKLPQLTLKKWYYIGFGLNLHTFNGKITHCFWQRKKKLNFENFVGKYT